MSLRKHTPMDKDYAAAGGDTGGTVWPFYLVADVSDSMRVGLSPTPFDALISGTDDLIRFIRDDVAAQDLARMCVIAFAGQPTVQMKLTHISKGYVLPAWPPGGSTNYSKVFTLLDQLIAEDISRLERVHDKVLRPTVFFITDGEPGNQLDGDEPFSSWGPPLATLKSRTVTKDHSRPYNVAIVAFGFDGAKESTLRQIYQPPGLALIAETGAADAGLLMRSIFDALVKSVAQSVSAGDLRLSVPKYMRVIS